MNYLPDVISFSNRGGRVLDSEPEVADIFPDIVKAARESRNEKKVLIIAD